MACCDDNDLDINGNGMMDEFNGVIFRGGNNNSSDPDIDDMIRELMRIRAQLRCVRRCLRT